LKTFPRTPRIFSLSLLIPVTISIVLEASKIRADYNIKTPNVTQIETSRKYANYFFSMTKIRKVPYHKIKVWDNLV